MIIVNLIGLLLCFTFAIHDAYIIHKKQKTDLAFVVGLVIQVSFFWLFVSRII